MKLCMKINNKKAQIKFDENSNFFDQIKMLFSDYLFDIMRLKFHHLTSRIGAFVSTLKSCSSPSLTSQSSRPLIISGFTSTSTLPLLFTFPILLITSTLYAPASVVSTCGIVKRYLEIRPFNLKKNF